MAAGTEEEEGQTFAGSSRRWRTESTGVDGKKWTEKERQQERRLGCCDGECDEERPSACVTPRAGCEKEERHGTGASLGRAPLKRMRQRHTEQERRETFCILREKKREKSSTGPRTRQLRRWSRLCAVTLRMNHV